MMRAAFLIAAAALLAAWASPGMADPPADYSTETPIHFMKRLFGSTADPQSESTVPLPRLRPDEAAAVARAPVPAKTAPETAAVASGTAKAGPEPDAVAAGPAETAPEPVALTAGAVPLPRLRPHDIAMAPAPEAAPARQETSAPEMAAAPEETPAPVGDVTPGSETASAPQAPPAADTTPEPETRLAALPAEPEPELAPASTPEPSTCGLVMASLGVMSQPLAPIDEGQCQVPGPVAISALDGGVVDLSTKAIVNCPLAETLAGWVRKNVETAATRIYGKQLTGLRVVDSYSCRPRDNIKGARLSEHAGGNAIDISAFRIGSRWVEVGPGWQAGGDDLAFLTSIRKAACGPFRTVLGPGADSFHTDHLHLDLAKRRTGGPSKGLYCR